MKKISKTDESAADYAAALDEIGGPKLAEILLEDDEEPAACRALAKLKGEKRDEVKWICGWFRGVADAIKREPIDVLRSARAWERNNETR